MTELKELEREKRKEMYVALAKRLDISNENSKKLFDYMEDECMVEITSPQEEESSLQTVKAEISHSGRFKGKSYKVGNIFFNIKDSIINSMAFGISTIASLGSISIEQPIIAILTAMAALLSAENSCKVDLEDDAVAVLAILWENKSLFGDRIKSKEALKLVNARLVEYNRDEISESRYNDLLDDLQAVKCIAIEDDKVILKEKVHISY